VETELRVGAIDFARTQVYAAMDHLELWINLAGRQAQGCVTLAEYDTLCADVAARLLQWREPSTGAPYIRDVQLQPDAATSLPHLGAIPPDLRLVWNPELALPALHELIAGDHEPGGAYIVRAPGVTFGPGPPHSLLDVAPTALHALGLEAQPTMEGCSLLLDKEQWA
jgi:predicted AlkP superfamily phosphohydrolase/phosphomutase